MARRPRLLAPGVLYHVIVRGNQRLKTFLADSDYQAYLERLGRYRKRLGGGAGRGWEVSRARALVGYVLIRRLGYKLKEVASCLGRDMATVSSLISRFAERLGKDERLRRQAKQLAEDCLE